MMVQGYRHPLTIRDNAERDQYQVIGPAYLHGTTFEDAIRILGEKKI